MAKIKHVEGNKLQLAIPLTIQTVTVDDGETSATVTDFVPNPSYPVEIVLKRGSKERRYDAWMDGNIAVMEDPGTLERGTYSVIVLCRNDAGEPLRFKQRDVVEVVDVTADAGIDPGIEYNAETHYLDATIFLFAKGDKGDGIAGTSVVESDEDDGYNVITITLTTGEEVTLHVKNGSKGYGISPETLQTILDGLERIKGLPLNIFLSESEYQTLVNADEVDPDAIYHTYEDE